MDSTLSSWRVAGHLSSKKEGGRPLLCWCFWSSSCLLISPPGMAVFNQCFIASKLISDEEVQDVHMPSTLLAARHLPMLFEKNWTMVVILVENDPVLSQRCSLAFWGNTLSIAAFAAWCHSRQLGSSAFEELICVQSMLGQHTVNYALSH